MKVSQTYPQHKLVTLLLAVCVMVLFACENDQKEIEKWTKDIKLPEVGKFIDGTLSQNGVVKAKLKAPEMIRMEGNSNDSIFTEFPKTLHVDFFNDSIKRESWLDAKYGKYYNNLNKIYLRDSIVIINMRGDTLWCHDMWWDQNTKLFYTDTVARYKSFGKNITGNLGMEATQDLKRVTFKVPVGSINTEVGSKKDSNAVKPSPSPVTP
jgi:LPS export ABC transporter protein LptC